MEKSYDLRASGILELKKGELREIEGGFLGMLTTVAGGLMLYFAVSAIENPEEVWEGFKDAFN